VVSREILVLVAIKVLTVKKVKLVTRDTKEMPDKRDLKVLPVYPVSEVPMVLKDQKVVMVPSVSQGQSVQWEKKEISVHLVFPDTMDREV